MTRNMFVWFVTGIFLIMVEHSQAQENFSNKISTEPFSPLFRHLQLQYERQIDSQLIIGAEGRYYYAAPPSDYDSIRSSGGDITLFLKIMTRKKPGGFYVLPGLTIGHYELAAGYGHISNSYIGDIEIITSAQQKSFLTYGGKLLLGYDFLINRFSIDLSTGLKFLILPQEVKDPPATEDLINAWGTYSWTDIPSPGSIFSLGIAAGYRF
jgi:hypothetical protein